ncbi:dephospho-CoA kinase [Flavobacteriaceae bacterium S356]|uniref:Dephospho-CoA kinase n=1 Tax=Asprobacillus argus TaxID=3076534 RepID=A0ABU3LEN6_9FLAO|nr:dephospho-CoA kinase [Flavobacteriaceae bacterium S356]
MVVGVTGGIGSGKSTVTGLFKEMDNVVLYIADKEAKKLMNHSSKIRQAVILEFGKESYKDGILNRAYLSECVFNNKEKLKRLNAIVHPEVHDHFGEFLKEHEKAIIIYENAILFEIGSDRFCDVIITVFTEEKERIRRVVERDNTTEKEVLDRIKNQWKDEKKIMLSNYIITNNFMNRLHSQVKQIHNILTKKMNYI